MKRQVGAEESKLCRKLGVFMRKCVFRILSVGVIPNHIAFILDGNRRFAKKHNLAGEGAGHRAGFLTLMSLLKYCAELSVKYVSIYAFSIDNFKRTQNEIRYLMDLMLEKMEFLLREDGFLSKYGVRVCFIGNLGLVSDPIRVTAEKVMRATSKNTRIVILICLAYSSTEEIVHTVEETCLVTKKTQPQAFKPRNPQNDVTEDADEHKNKEQNTIKLVDLEKHMYMGVYPNPDILIRTSGENRLSNFLLWQSSNCMLYSPAALWPEIGLRHLIWAILNFQRHHAYLEKKKKQL